MKGSAMKRQSYMRLVGSPDCWRWPACGCRFQPERCTLPTSTRAFAVDAQPHANYCACDLCKARHQIVGLLLIRFLVERTGPQVIGDQNRYERDNSDMLNDPFVLSEWLGCSDMDCLPGCWVSPHGGHCARLAKWLEGR